MNISIMFPVAATSYGLIKLSVSDLFNTDVLYLPIACASCLSPGYLQIGSSCFKGSSVDTVKSLKITSQNFGNSIQIILLNRTFSSIENGLTIIGILSNRLIT
jgi:hypothetical protein